MYKNIATLHGTLPFAAFLPQRYTLSPILQNFTPFFSEIIFRCSYIPLMSLRIFVNNIKLKWRVRNSRNLSLFIICKEKLSL